MAGRTADGLRPARANAAACVSRAGKPRDRVNPALTERIYSPEEWEFMKACEEYKREYGLRFLNDSDYFRVLYRLGYRKVPGVGRPPSTLDITA